MTASPARGLWQGRERPAVSMTQVAAVVANFPPTDLARWATQQPVFKFAEAEAAQFSPIRFVSPGSAPSLIVLVDQDGRARVLHLNQWR